MGYIKLWNMKETYILQVPQNPMVHHQCLPDLRTAGVLENPNEFTEVGSIFPWFFPQD